MARSGQRRRTCRESCASSLLLLSLVLINCPSTPKTPKTAAAPTFSPAAGIYTIAQNVTIATPTEGAEIRYTSDGTDPSATSGTVYSGPVARRRLDDAQGRRREEGLGDSAVVGAEYTITGTVAGVTFSPAPGSFTGLRRRRPRERHPGRRDPLHDRRHRSDGGDRYRVRGAGAPDVLGHDQGAGREEGLGRFGASRAPRTPWPRVAAGDRRGSRGGPRRDRPGPRVRRGALRSRQPRRGPDRPRSGPGGPHLRSGGLARRAGRREGEGRSRLPELGRPGRRGPGPSHGGGPAAPARAGGRPVAARGIRERHGRHRGVGRPVRPGRLRGRPRAGLPGAEGHGRSLDPARRAPALGEDAAHRHRAAHGRGRGDGRLRRGTGPEGHGDRPVHEGRRGLAGYRLDDAEENFGSGARGGEGHAAPRPRGAREPGHGRAAEGGGAAGRRPRQRSRRRPGSPWPPTRARW